MNYIKKIGAILCTVVMIAGGAAAEEKRLGDYIYVPAMNPPGSVGTIGLRVEGLSVDADGKTQIASALPGAEFGVYVMSESGQLTPWANPLLPSEPMRIRTGNETVSFALPQQMEFYIRQEKAPEGYVCDSQTLIPVTGEDIVVRNLQAGELLVHVRDNQGTALEGVEIEVIGSNGTPQILTTDEEGKANIHAGQNETFSIRELSLPDGVYDAQSVSINGERGNLSSISAHVEMAKRTEVVFEHQAAGIVQLNMTIASVNANAEQESHPLPDVVLEIIGQETLQTDESGHAQTSLPEGTYDIQLSYAGEKDLVLPFSHGSIVVESGKETVIERSAAQNEGRIAVQAHSERPISDAAISFVHDVTGIVYGPYAFDNEGLAISETLPVGSYHIKDFSVPDSVVPEYAQWNGTQAVQVDDLSFFVEPGKAASIQIQMQTIVHQDFSLVLKSTDDNGEEAETALTSDLSVEVISASDNSTVIGAANASGGHVKIEAPEGQYVLRLNEQDAQRLNVQAESETFTLPSAQEVVSFRDKHARVMIRSVDENGLPVQGAVYTVSDNSGKTYTVEADENGEAVTPLISAGETIVRTKQSPENHDQAQEMRVQASSGQVSNVQMTHVQYGTAKFSVQMKHLDARGASVYSPIAGAQLRLYAVEDGGQRITDTGIELTSGKDGTCFVKLAPGEYVAQAQGLKEEYQAPQSLRFSMQNAQETTGELVCMDTAGGVIVRLTAGELNSEQLAQVRFDLLDADGQIRPLRLQNDQFYAGDLPAGTYVLRQTQMPEGYTLSPERTVSIAGGEAVEIEVPLEEYAMLSVSKTGLTFNDQLQTYIVPLTGKYGVYTDKDGQLYPYPSASTQEIVWANASSEYKNTVRLPASVQGTTYYLKELGNYEGFAQDTQVYEVTLFAGKSQTLECTVSSDRGFFTFNLTDTATGLPVEGGEFELIDDSGECVLKFESGSDAYRNTMALPVGNYTLRQLKAAPGYALSYSPEMSVRIPAYLSLDGQMADVSMKCLALPQSERMDAWIEDMYAGQEQGLTLISVSTDALPDGQALVQPRLELSIREKTGARVNISSVIIPAVSDAFAGRYRARVEYCLSGGGWRPSDARVTNILDTPFVVNLSDVQDDISAVRVTYFNEDTGLEIMDQGFSAGSLTFNIQSSVEGQAQLLADVALNGSIVYQNEFDGNWNEFKGSASRQLDFQTQGTGLFKTVSAGRDGRISGQAFFDENANGLMDHDETGRYAGLTVSLIAQSGETVNTCRTDMDGRYAFDTISSGKYTLQFDADENVIFTHGQWFSDHIISSIQDRHYGISAPIAIDGDHTDYIVNAGCIYAGEINGSVQELFADGSLNGAGGLSIEMYRDQDTEPSVVMTDDLGHFRFSGIVPGAYSVVLNLPDGFLCTSAKDGKITQNVEIGQGDSIQLENSLIQREALVSGRVLIDDDGNGNIDPQAESVPDVCVLLLRVQDGHTEIAAQTYTDDRGAYVFDGLYAGEYSVLFELNGKWAFTRYSEDSSVYGAVSNSGSTQVMTLKTGEQIQNINAGVTIPAEMTVSVFQDTQVDGQKGVYEEMLSGVSISLIRQENGEDTESITYKTGEDGTVVFAGISPGEYVISYQMPGQWRTTKQVDPSTTQYPVSQVPQSSLSTGRSNPFLLTMGQSGVRMTIGAMLSGSISGVVYYDDNVNARFDSEEMNCPDIQVELLDLQDNVLSAANTLDDGSYAFEGLAPGRYRVRFTADESCGFSGTERTMARGGVQASDHYISTTRIITVTSGTDAANADAGIVRLSSLTGMVWEDQNADGIRQNEERTLTGVTVHLMNGAGRSILLSTETDANGAFAFEHLKPGDYKLRVDAPDHYVFSGAAQNSVLPLESKQEGRGYSASFELLGGVNVENILFGLLTQGKISGQIWQDKDYDGLMDEEEEGLRGASITLLGDNREVLQTVQSVRSGSYSFDNLMPGSYTLRIELPEGYVYTLDGKDSVTLRSNDVISEFNVGQLRMGETIEHINIGALNPVQVGGVVWYDQDNDGRRANADSGISGTRAVLTMLSGADAGMTFETKTNEDGSYRFENVMPGQARIGFTLPDNHAFAIQAEGTYRVSRVPQTDASYAETESFDLVSGENMANMDIGAVTVGKIKGKVWEDSQYDGTCGWMEGGVSGTQIDLIDLSTGKTVRSAISDEKGEYVLDFVREGEYKLAVNLPNGMIFTREGESVISGMDTHYGETEQLTVAMGENLEGLQIGSITPAGISGRMIIDENSSTSGTQNGLPGAVVTLMQGGTVVATTKTDSNGQFDLSNLRPGTYRIRMALPSDTLFAQHVDLELANADDQEGQTKAFTLKIGQNVTLDSISTVQTNTLAGCAWADQNINGRMDENEAALANVRVELLNEHGEVLSEKTVNESGQYAFHLLRSGTYALRFTLPNGELFTDRLNVPGASCVNPVEGNIAQTEYFTLTNGEKRLELNVGSMKPGKIGDSVWLDVNGNGLQDYREPLLPNVQLNLIRMGEKEEIKTTIESDEYGYYCFDQLRPGTYVIEVQESDSLTLRLGAPLGEIDSDIDPDSRRSDPISLYSGQILRNIDIGFIQQQN